MTEFGITLCFDSSTESKLRSLQGALRSLELNPHDTHLFARPHVTMAVVKGGLSTDLSERMRDFTSTQEEIHVEIGSVGMRPKGDNDIFLTLLPSPELLNLHSALLSFFRNGFMVVNDYHRIDRWLPHITVAYSLTDTEFTKAIELCRNSNVFGLGSLVEIVIVGQCGMEVGSFPLLAQIKDRAEQTNACDGEYAARDR